jgi:ankyrin repeat protein
MDARELPAHPRLDQYKKQAKELLKAFRAADEEAMRRMRKGHPRLRKLAEAEFRGASVVLADAQLVIAREHAFESWPKFAKYVKDLARRNSPASIFESAADAVVAGDLATLMRLLGEHPALIRARSSRAHRSTLLHYISANGVEDFRQKSPKNAVVVARLLLEAGAEVDAENHDYAGGGTALGLVATSYPPARAGVQIALLEILLAAGASTEGRPGGWKPLNAALANGRGDAAEYLAKRGAHLDLEGAAGTGQLDAVRKFFTEDGKLKASATVKQLESGLGWACEYGRTKVVEFLLQEGLSVDAKIRRGGSTGLHWAAYNAHVDIVKLLLKRKAPVNAIDNAYNGTPLGWALYAWSDPPPEASRDDYYEVVALLAGAGANVDPEWLDSSRRGKPIAAKIKADARMQAALRGEQKG